MILKPDFDLLERIGISFFHRSQNLIVEDDYFFAILRFFEKQNAGEAIHELLAYQLHFGEGPKRIVKSNESLLPDQIAMQRIAELLKKSKLQRVVFEFADKPNETAEKVVIQEEDLLFDLENVVRGILDSYDEGHFQNQVQFLTNEKKNHSKFKRIIQETSNDILKILQAKNPNASMKDAMLCTYAIYFRYGYRLNFQWKGRDKEEMTEEDFQKMIIETSDPLEDSFSPERVYYNIKRK